MDNNMHDDITEEWQKNIIIDGFIDRLLADSEEYEDIDWKRMAEDITPKNERNVFENNPRRVNGQIFPLEPIPARKLRPAYHRSRSSCTGSKEPESVLYDFCILEFCNSELAGSDIFSEDGYLHIRTPEGRQLVIPDTAVQEVLTDALVSGQHGYFIREGDREKFMLPVVLTKKFLVSHSAAGTL